MRRTRHVVLPVRSWQYMGLLIVSLACLTLGLVSRDREGKSGSLAGPELEHRAPHDVDACPNLNPFVTPISHLQDKSTQATTIKQDTSETSRILLNNRRISRSVDRDINRVRSQELGRRVSRNDIRNDASRRILEARYRNVNRENRFSRTTIDSATPRLSRSPQLESRTANDRRNREFRLIRDDRDIRRIDARRTMDRRENREIPLARRILERRVQDRRSRLTERHEFTSIDRRENRAASLDRRTNERRDFDIRRSRSSERHEFIGLDRRGNRAISLDRRVAERRNSMGLRINRFDVHDRRSRSSERREFINTNRRERREVERSIRENRRETERRETDRARENRRNLPDRFVINRESNRESLKTRNSGKIDRNNNLAHRNLIRQIDRRDSRRSFETTDRSLISRFSERRGINDVKREARDRRVRSLERRDSLERTRDRRSRSERRQIDERSVERSMERFDDVRRERDARRSIDRRDSLRGNFRYFAERRSREMNSERRQRIINSPRDSERRERFAVRDRRSISPAAERRELNNEERRIRIVRSSRNLERDTRSRNDYRRSDLERRATINIMGLTSRRSLERTNERRIDWQQSMERRLDRKSFELFEDSRRRTDRRSLERNIRATRDSVQNRREQSRRILLGTTDEIVPHKFLKQESILKYMFTYETMRQAFLVALCTVYGLSIYNGKRFFISDVARQVHRFVVW